MFKIARRFFRRDIDYSKNYYQTLGVPKTSTSAELRSAYYKLAKIYHPDANQQKSDKERKQASEKMKEITEAYDIVGNDDKRKSYDDGGGWQGRMHTMAKEAQARQAQQRNRHGQQQPWGRQQQQNPFEDWFRAGHGQNPDQHNSKQNQQGTQEFEQMREKLRKAQENYEKANQEYWQKAGGQHRGPFGHGMAGANGGPFGQPRKPSFIEIILRVLLFYWMVKIVFAVFFGVRHDDPRGPGGMPEPMTSREGRRDLFGRDIEHGGLGGESEGSIMRQHHQRMVQEARRVARMEEQQRRAGTLGKNEASPERKQLIKRATTHVAQKAGYDVDSTDVWATRKPPSARAPNERGRHGIQGDAMTGSGGIKHFDKNGRLQYGPPLGKEPRPTDEPYGGDFGDTGSHTDDHSDWFNHDSTTGTTDPAIRSRSGGNTDPADYLRGSFGGSQRR